MIVGDDQRLGGIRALKPFQIEFDDRHADDLAVTPHRLRDVVAGIMRDRADAEETAYAPLHGIHEIRPELILAADEALRLLPVARRDAKPVRLNDVSGRGPRVAVEVFQIAIGAQDIWRGGTHQHVLHERMLG